MKLARLKQLKQQHGSVLLITLIFLLLLTLAASAAMRTSTMELRMAGNEQTRLDALVRIQSVVDAVLSEPGNFVISGAPGFTNCNANVSGCDRQTISINASVTAAYEQSGTTLVVERLAPALTPAPPGITPNADAFLAARFQVDAEYDGTGAQGGRAGIVQGVIVLIPRDAQTDTARRSVWKTFWYEKNMDGL
ncbi:MAG: PilX N-terminal domain-containing pilus assembly protein [Pseudohongiellaceae bacterium]